jgi:ABC-type nitrate/sulfonate/bicarbonate transport system substrate-binding protein
LDDVQSTRQKDGGRTIQITHLACSFSFFILEADLMSEFNRRAFLKTAAGTSLAAMLGPHAHAQPAEKVTLSLAGVPMGGSAYVFVAKALGLWSKRGLDVDIARGNGSLAVSTAVGAGKFEFGLVQMPAIVLAAMGGLSLTCVGIGQYSLTFATGVLADSPIRQPRDLEGKTIAGVPTSGDAPFRALHAQRAGFDFSKVNVLNVDFTLLEQVVMQKKADGMFAIANTSLPPCVSQGVNMRFMMWNRYGLDFYGTSIVTQKSIAEKRPELCQKFFDGAMEAIAFTLTKPDEALEIFMKAVPEVAYSKSGREFIRLGIGIFNTSIIVPEAATNGLGWADFGKLGGMVDLIAQYQGKAGAAKVTPNDIFTNTFAGKVKLSDAQWTLARKNAEPFQKFLT